MQAIRATDINMKTPDFKRRKHIKHVRKLGCSYLVKNKTTREG
jgi:hypothetical protein